MLMDKAMEVAMTAAGMVMREGYEVVTYTQMMYKIHMIIGIVGTIFVIACVVAAKWLIEDLRAMKKFRENHSDEMNPIVDVNFEEVN